VDKNPVIDVTLDQIEQIKEAAGVFRKNVGGLVKDMNVSTEGWRFNVESHEKGVIVDVAIKMLITKK
jgi:hypothetical protein